MINEMVNVSKRSLPDERLSVRGKSNIPAEIFDKIETRTLRWDCLVPNIIPV